MKNKKTRFFSFFLFTFVLLLSTVVVDVFATEIVDVTTFVDLKEEINEVVNGKKIITISKGFDFEESISIPTGKDITIISNDKQSIQTLDSLSGSSPLFDVSGGQLTLSHIVLNNVRVKISSGYFFMEDGAIIQNAKATYGGAVYLTGGHMEMTGGIIQNNSAGNYGGGVYMTNSTFNMSGGTIQSNSMHNTGAGGGLGVYVHENATFKMSGGVIQKNNTVLTQKNGGGVLLGTSTSSFEMKDTALIQNNSSTQYGGGLYIEKGASATLLGGRIDHNNATSGGGGIFTLGTLNISRGEIMNNTSGSGGGIYIYNGANVSIGNMILKGNIATGSGGGIFGFESFDITQSIISNNKANNGGGIYMYKGKTSDVKKSSFDGNIAHKNGGAIYIQDTAQLKATDYTIFKNNQAHDIDNHPNGAGGGIFAIDLNDITTDQTIAFAGNNAPVAYFSTEDIIYDYPSIQFESFTIPENPINNFDINYVGDEIFETDEEFIIKIVDSETLKPLENFPLTLIYQKEDQQYYYGMNQKNTELLKSNNKSFYWSLVENDETSLQTDKEGRIHFQSLQIDTNYQIIQNKSFSGYQELESSIIQFAIVSDEIILYVTPVKEDIIKPENEDKIEKEHINEESEKVNKDKLKENANKEEPMKKDNKNIIITSDSSQLYIWFVLLSFSIVGLFILRKKQQKRSYG